MKYRNLVAALLGLAIAAMPSISAPGKQLFQYQAKSVTVPDLLDKGKLFLEPQVTGGNWFGGGLAVGDWNQDGHSDIFISSFLADPDGITNAGAIYVFLGPDFVQSEKITALPSPEEGDNFGMQIEWEDMNNDKIPDLVTTGLRSRYYPEDGSAMIDQAGSFRVVWGPDYNTGVRFFEELPEYKATIGRGLAVGDFNGDGKQDIAVGAPGAYSNQGKVIFRYGTDFTEQEEIQSPVSDVNWRFGVSLCAGDWNRDGKIDLLVGSDYATSKSGEANAGHIEIWYGPDYKEDTVKVFEEPTPAAENHFGTSIDMGDVTGDGIPDLISGCSGALWEGKSWAGKVLIFPGPDFTEAIELDSPTPDENCIFGSEVKVADVNGDGVNDLVAGEYYATVDGKSMAGRAWLFLGIKTDIHDWALF